MARMIDISNMVPRYFGLVIHTKSHKQNLRGSDVIKRIDPDWVVI